MLGRRHHILHLIETSEPGGAETVLANIASSLDPKKYRSTVCLLQRDWLDTRLDDLGVPYVVIPNKRPYDPIFLWRLVRLIRKHHIDLLHAHEFMMIVYAALAGWLTRRPMIGTQHGKLYFPDQPRRIRAYRLAFRLASCLIAVSEELRRFMLVAIEPPHRHKLITLYNGIDLTRYTKSNCSLSVRRELRVGESAPLIISVGSLFAVKGINYLLKAFVQVRQQYGDAVLLIVGDGDQRITLENRAQQLGLQEAVRFVGFRDDVPSLLSAANLYVCSSVSEGLSLAVLEAMAIGLPIVATNVGGNPELVTDGRNGFLVPSKAPIALAEKILTALSDTALRERMGRRSRDRVNESFSLATMIDGYQSLYEELLT